MDETKTPQQTPEELLKLLDIQLQMQRAKRQRSAQNRTTMRLLGIFLIIGGGLVALLILQYAMSEFGNRSRGSRGPEDRQEQVGGNF
jgi:hypothetical protein